MCAEFDLFQTSSVHVSCKCHVFIDFVGDGFDPVGIVVGKDRVVGCLDVFVDDPVDDSKVDEFKVFALLGAVGNRLVLLVEVVEEPGTVMT